MNNWQNNLIEIINNLPIDQFKKFCTLFLEKTGLSNVVLKTNDDKVLGKGSVELGIVLSYNFVFLGKQETSIVSESILDEIRKLPENNTNKGLLLTTGVFPKYIKRKAKAKGEIPIDLIDGKDLVERLRKMRLGVSTNEDNTVIVEKQWFADL